MSAPGRTSTPPPERLAIRRGRAVPALRPRRSRSLAAFNKRTLLVALPLVFTLIAVAS
jgi:hypothetical protein